MNESIAIAEDILKEHPDYLADNWLIIREVMWEFDIWADFRIKNIDIIHAQDVILTLDAGIGLARMATAIKGQFTAAHMIGLDPRELYQLVLLRLL